MSKRGYTYVDQYGVGIAATEINDGDLLLHIYPTDNGKPIGVQIPAKQQRELADAITDFYTKKINRVLDAVREHRVGTGAEATVPAGAVLAAIYISDSKPSAEDIKRAHEIQALIDADNPP
jgi:hypothetical protein